MTKTRRPAIRRSCATLLAAVAGVLAVASPAWAAPIAFSAPEANSMLSQARVGVAYSSDTVFQTNCASSGGDGTPGTWDIPSNTTGLTATLSKGTNADGSGNTTLTLSGTATTVRNGRVTVRFTRSNNGSDIPCDKSTNVTRTVHFAAVYTYPANSFGVTPTGVTAFNGSGQHVYVTGSNTSQIFEVANAATNPPSGAVSEITGSFGALAFPIGLATTGTGATPTRIFTTNFNNANSAVLSHTNPSAAGQVRDLAGCSNPAGVSPSHDGVRMFVACAGSNRVHHVDASGGPIGTGAGLALDDLDAAPAGVARVPGFRAATGPNPGGSLRNTVVVGDAQNDKLYLLQEGPNGPQKRTVNTGTNPTALPAGCVPANIAAATTEANATTVFVACPGTGTVVPVTLSIANSGAITMQAQAPITVGSRPFGVALNPAGTQLVVADSGDDTARSMTVSATTGAVTAGSLFVMNVGDVPSGVGIVPAAGGINLAYIANGGDGSAWVVDPPETGGANADKDKKPKSKASASDVTRLRGRASSLPLVAPVD